MGWELPHGKDECINHSYREEDEDGVGMGEDSNEFCKCAKGEDDEEADVENKVGDTVEGRTHGIMVVTHKNQFRICIIQDLGVAKRSRKTVLELTSEPSEVSGCWRTLRNIVNSTREMPNSPSEHSEPAVEQILSHKESGKLYRGKVSLSRFCKPLGPKRPRGDAQHLEGLNSVWNSWDVRPYNRGENSVETLEDIVL